MKAVAYCSSARVRFLREGRCKHHASHYRTSREGEYNGCFLALAADRAFSYETTGIVSGGGRHMRSTLTPPLDFWVMDKALYQAAATYEDVDYQSIAIMAPACVVLPSMRSI